MQIRIGYELIYDCPQPTPMVLMLTVHHTRAADLVVMDRLVADPPLPIHAYHDSFGNWCSRIVVPAGRTRLSARGIVNDTGEPDPVALAAVQHTIPDLPDDAMMFLLGSRYCETERLADIAWSLFGKTPLGWGRVQAICDFVHQHIL
jgi:transglutaminase-like putative cysteine protease